MDDNILQLPYDEAREKIEDGDILLFKNGSSVASWIIKIFLGSPYYHTSFAMWLRDPNYTLPRLMSVEQHTGGQRIVNIASYDHCEFEVFKNPYDWFKFGPELLDTCGEVAYSYVDLAAIGMTERYRLKLKNVKGEVCSEMVMHCLRDQGFPYPSSLVSPGKLRALLIQQGIPIKFSVIPKHRLS